MNVIWCCRNVSVEQVDILISKNQALASIIPCIYVTRFAKSRHNDAFLEFQIFASVNFVYLKLCSVAISMLYC